MNLEFGKKGEKLAWEFLTKQGYTLLGQNYRKRNGEIDLIALDPASNEIVFIEVKARHSADFGYPEEAVNALKIKKMSQVAQNWLAESGMQAPSWRLDVIAIQIKAGKPEIVHLKNIGD
jgi:putative endonuclease